MLIAQDGRGASKLGFMRHGDQPIVPHWSEVPVNLWDMDFLIVGSKDGDGWHILAGDDIVRPEFEQVAPVTDQRPVGFVRSYSELHNLCAKHGTMISQVVGISEIEQDLGPIPA